MKVRIIFRGLVLFRFERSDSDELYDGEGCKLRALLINRPGSKGVHDHTPKIGIIGRDPTTKFFGERQPITGRQVALKFTPTGMPDVVKDASFETHVPKLSDVYGDQPNGPPNRKLVAAEIVVPAGLIRAKTLVSWTPRFHGPELNSGAEMPMKVEFLWSPAWEPRLVASECVLEADIKPAPDETAVGIELSTLEGHEVDRNQVELPGRVAPLTVSAPRHEVDPDTVDILVTNFAPQRRISVPWSVHYQWFFEAAGYEARPDEGGKFEAFAKVAEKFSREEWEHDVSHALNADGTGFPIPYVSGFLTERSRARVRSHARVGDDPESRPVCPPAME